LKANGEIEGKGPLGLITGHAYSVTGVKMVAIKTARADGSIPLGKLLHFVLQQGVFYSRLNL